MKENILIEVYKEQCTHGRHHEAQRTAMSNLILIAATGIIAFVTFDDKLNLFDLPIALFLVILGLFGALFSVKFGERFKHHSSRSREIRNQLDENISELLKTADQKHDSLNKHSVWIKKLNITRYWVLLHMLISAIGIVLSLLIIFENC